MKITFVTVLSLSVLTGCHKAEIRTNFANEFPKFEPSQQEYLVGLPFADSISGSYEYQHKANWFWSSEKNIALLNVYLKSRTTVDEKGLKIIDERLNAAESGISNRMIYDELHYTLFQNGKEFQTIIRKFEH